MARCAPGVPVQPEGIRAQLRAKWRGHLHQPGERPVHQTLVCWVVLVVDDVGAHLREREVEHGDPAGSDGILDGLRFRWVPRDNGGADVAEPQTAKHFHRLAGAVAEQDEGGSQRIRRRAI